MPFDRYSTPVRTETELTLAIVQVGKLAEKVGFKNGAKSMIMTAASELGRNILKYAGSGNIHVAPLVKDHKKGIELIAMDHGPGIENVDLAMQDAFSSGGTLGLGLPGVKRMMDEFTLDTTPKRGTTVTIRKWV
ncbi:MAG: ATP-binding protein [Nitrospirota bacterium]|nr:MAG: ATP-binding protein [Nitrospirota bacterium]